MPEISALKQQIKNPERVSVFVDEKYSFSLTLDQLLEQKLKKGDVLEEARIKELKKLSDEGKIRARALEWLMGRPHSERELRDYLYRKKVDKTFLDALVGEFIEKKYLNDAQFARWFAENRQRKQKSTRAIISELRSKGISPSTIQSVVTELGLSQTEDEMLVQLVNKLRNRHRYKDDQKLMRYLVSKGFGYSAIKTALQQDGISDDI